MMKKQTLIIIALLTISFSYSQEWELLTVNSEGQEIYTRPHSKYTAWFKTTPVQISIENDKTVEGYTVQLAKFDCRNKKMGLVAYFEYNKEGSVLDSNQTEDVLVKMEYSPPETIGEFMINKFCKKTN